MPSLVRLFVDDVLRKTALVNLTGTNGETFLTVYFKEESSPKVELRAVFLVGLDPNNIKVRQELNINTSTAVCFDNPMFPRAQPSIEMYAATVVPATSSSGAGSLEAPGGAMSQFNPSAALPGAVAAGAKLCVFQFGIKIYDCRLDHFCGSSALYHDVLRRSEQSNTFWSQKFSSEVYETRCPPLEDPHLGLPSENALIICVTPTIEIHSSVLLHLDTCGLQASAPLTGQAGAADGPDKFMQYILFRRSPFLLDDVSRYVKRYDKSIERKEMLDKNCIFMMIFKPSANASPPAGHSMGASMLAAPPSVVNVPPPQSLQANPALVGQPPLHQHQHQQQQQHQHQQHQHQVPVSQAPYAPGPAGPYGAQVMAPMGPMGYPQGGGYPGHHQPPPGPGQPQHYMPEQPPSIYDPTAATPYGGGPAYPYPHAGGGGAGPGPPHPYAHMHPQHGSQAQGPPHAANNNSSGSNHGSGGPKQWTIPEGLAKLSELIRIEGGKLHSKVIGRAFRNYHLEAAEFIEAAVRNCVPASLTSLLSKHPECGIKRDTIDKMFNLVIDMDSNIGRVQMGSQHNSGGGDRNGGRDGRGGGSSGADRGNGGGFNMQTMMMQSSAYGQPPMPYGPGGNMVPMVPGGGIYGPVTNPIVPSHYTVGGPRAPPPPPSSSVPSSDGMSRYGPLGGAAAPAGRERGRDRGSRSRSRSRERGRDRGRDRDRSRSRSRERGRRGRDRRGRSVSSSPSPGAPPRDRERRGERGAYAAERRARGQEIKERKLEARRGQVCPQFKDGFCLWGRRCNMAHPSEMQRTDVVRPSGKQLDEAVNTLSRYLYHVGAPEGNHRAMVYEKVYEMFRRAHPEHHKTLDDLVLIDPDVENIGSAIVSKEVSRHLLSFRRGRQEDGELGATRSVLLVENAIVNVAL